MAMTKKEREEVAVLRNELALALAWRRTSPVKKDLAPPSTHGLLSRGWNFNTYNGDVMQMCSSSAYHGYGWEKTTSQGPVWLYSTRAKALAALRWETEREAAEKLADIDRRIAACEKEQAP